MEEKKELSIINNKKTTVSEIYKNERVALSNALIQARQKTSLMESKIELLAIHKVRKNPELIEKEDAKKKKYTVHAIELTNKEIKQIMGNNTHRIYEQLQGCAYELKQKIYIYRDPSTEQFTMSSLYGDVNYENGKMRIEFNPSTEHLFMELGKGFTQLNLAIAMSFKTNGGFQIYKMLQVEAYKLGEIDLDKSQEEQEEILFQIQYQELRLELGYIDITQPDIKKEAAKSNPNYDVIEELDKKKKPKYAQPRDFINKIVMVGIEEINNISDLYVTMGKETGAHGKIEGINFRVQRNLKYYKHDDEGKEEQNSKKNLTEEDKMDFYFDVKALLKDIPDEITSKQIREISELVNFEMDVLKKAHEYTLNSKYDDYYRYLYSTVKNKYYESPKQAKKNKEQEYEKQDYDFEELEKLKLQRQKKD